ncbi:CPBP family intramembrane glutamic endopeptidase [Actinomadura opuntiae]|uniref:CPBP family intramembrane glutamic endopeptidase n=1 Tax=Actinomadura sp. OS1-43 TaxID=604315 RepID=UPI00255A7C94|nr:CPBP family intramembrane glutamic endopeptidase [Actinomadura sp. OS1-43]MDL4819789.1 CPBP family intramembrane metalloprotease [Actinomadura sp. OS1-43]
MPEPADEKGWAPLDPGMSGESPDPPAQRPPMPGPPPPPVPQPPVQQQPLPQAPVPQAPAAGWTWPADQHAQQAPPAPMQPPYYGAQPYQGAPPYQGQYAAPDQPPYGPYAPQGFAGYGPPPPKGPWTVGPPPGTPFHRMARTPLHRWWRPLAGSVAIVLAGMALAVGMMIAGMVVRVVATGDAPDISGSDTDTLFGNSTADLAFNLATIAIFLPMALLAAWLLQRRRPGTLASVAGRLRGRWLLTCCGLALAFCAVSYASSIIASAFVDDSSSGGEHWVGWGRFVPAAIVIVLLVPLQSSAEEVVFRGWLLQAVGACALENRTGRVGRALSAVFRTPWPGIVIGSAAFTSLHGYTGWGILDIFVFGAIAAWLATRTGGLESGIALHVFNNLLAFLGPAAVGQLDIDQGDVPWQYVVADIVPMVLYAAAVVWLARRKRIQTVTQAPGDAAGVDAPALDAEPELASRAE